MKGLNKVIWAEGVFLGQQHFQAWDRYLEGSQQLRDRALHPFAWGLLSANVDEKALENRRFQLLECSAIFPDGRLVHYDAAEGAPLVCELSASGGQSLEVYLCLPANHRVEGISGYPRRGQLCAWQADYHQVGDAYDPNREREVLLARPNLRLLASGESREHFVSFKIAELVNGGDGGYRQLPQYIPPLVRIGASACLKALLGRMIEGVGAKLRTLNERRANFSGGPSEFARTDPAQFLMLQSLGGLQALLLHFQQQPDLHPEYLYRALGQAVGGLGAFGPEPEAAAPPCYQHTDLAGVFQGFERLLGALINLPITSRTASLSLTRETESLLSAAGIARATLQHSHLFLGVLFEAEDPVWITDFARQVKVASRDTIEQTVASALPGVRMVHAQRPPSKLSTRSGYEYFRLEPRGDFWAKVLEEGSLALFMPQHFAGATVELVTVQE